MIDRLWSSLANDLAIDLGTANTLVFVQGRGILIREPSTVAVHQKTKEVLSVGREAKKMIGKTPANIVALRPLKDGVISDFDSTEAMLKFFIRKVNRSYRYFPPRIPRPRVVIGIPSGVTEVERKAVIDATLRAGARKVFLIEEPMAAAIGAGLPIEEPTGNMVVDIGGGTSEMAVISLGGIVNSHSIRVAGDKMDEEIISWTKEQHNLLIGEKSAEEIKLTLANTWEGALDESIVAHLRGRDLKSGLPKQIQVTPADLRAAIQKPIRLIIENVKNTVEETPPELISDLYQNGIVLAGGGALIKGLDKLLAEETQMPVLVDEDPLTTVVRGCGKALEEIELLKKVQVQ